MLRVQCMLPCDGRQQAVAVSRNSPQQHAAVRVPQSSGAATSLLRHAACRCSSCTAFEPAPGLPPSAGKNGKTKFTVENATRTRIVLADTRIHILG